MVRVHVGLTARRSPKSRLPTFVGGVNLTLTNRKILRSSRIYIRRLFSRPGWIMTDSEANLLQILRKRSFKLGEFTLTSGKKSDHYIDGKMSATFSASAYLIGEVLYERTISFGLDAIGGLEVGAVPLVTAAVISYHLRNRTMEGFWVRDKQKSHGTKKKIEGGIDVGWRVAVIDDVFTAGGSAMKAVEAAREAGAEVVTVIALVDRLQGARELFAANGITNYQAVFTVDDLREKPSE